MAGTTWHGLLSLPRSRGSDRDRDRRGCGEEGGGHGNGERSVGSEPKWGSEPEWGEFESLNLASPPIPGLCGAGGDRDEGR